MQTISPRLQPALIDLLYSLADDKLMLGHRNAEWTGLGPILEEDIAFSAIAQDELAHAQALYEFIARLTGQDADALAYGRKQADYRCAALVESPDDFDYAMAILRQFFCAHFNASQLDRLAQSNYAPLAALTSRMRAEEQIHLEHADGWIQRLGMAGDESRNRLQRALDGIGPAAASLCQPTANVAQLESAGVYPGSSTQMCRAYLDAVSGLLRQSGLQFPKAMFEPDSIPSHGGRTGQHSAGFPELLAELTEVYQVEPNARW